MAEVRRILAVKLSALGDLFHAVPVVERLHAHFACPVDWVTQPEYADLVRCHSAVDRVIEFPRRRGLRAWIPFVQELRRESYDLAVDLQGLSKSGLVLGLARATRKIAPSHPRELCRFFANETAPEGIHSPHAMDRLFDTLRYVGVPIEPVIYPLRFPPAAALPGRNLPRVAVAPRSRWAAKDWPEEKFIKALQLLRAKRPFDLYILGGPADLACGERIRIALGEGTWNLCGKAPLLELGAILPQMNVLLCNDSGPMHFAAAVGTPLVALFGPTDPARTGPWGDGHSVLRPSPGPQGYPDPRSYKNGDGSFIAQIPVEDVVDAVLRVLDAQLSSRPPSSLLYAPS